MGASSRLCSSFRGHRIVAVRDLPKVKVRVRFPLPAPPLRPRFLSGASRYRHCSTHDSAILVDHGEVVSREARVSERSGTILTSCITSISFVCRTVTTTQGRLQTLKSDSRIISKIAYKPRRITKLKRSRFTRRSGLWTRRVPLSAI